MKSCRDCRETKEQEEFIRNKIFASGYDTLCKACNRKRVKAWRKNNPEKRAVQQQREGKQDYNRAKHLRVTYGISLEEYNQKFIEQQGCCAICNKHQTLFKKNLSVDHCHTTGVVRDLLCNSCNTMIGFAEECPDILANAIKYLKKHTGY